MISAGVSNAAVHATAGSSVEQQIHLKQDPGDDWIPWGSVIGSYNSEQECLNAGQRLANAGQTVHCQKVKNGGAWVLF
jgi:hypothetical protein